MPPVCAVLSRALELIFRLKDFLGPHAFRNSSSGYFPRYRLLPNHIISPPTIVDISLLDITPGWRQVRTMDIRGLVLVNSESETMPGLLRQPAHLSLFDVAGKSPLLRMVERLSLSGIQPITILVEENSACLSTPQVPKDVQWLKASSESFWRTAENIFNQMSQTGAE